MKREEMLVREHWRDLSLTGLPFKQAMDLRPKDLEDHALVIPMQYAHGGAPAAAAQNFDEVNFHCSSESVDVELFYSFNSWSTRRDLSSIQVPGFVQVYLLPRRFDPLEDEFMGFMYYETPTKGAAPMTLTNTIKPAYTPNPEGKPPIVFTAPSEAHKPDAVGTFLQLGDDQGNMACAWLDAVEVMQLFANALEAMGIKDAETRDPISYAPMAWIDTQVEVFDDKVTAPLPYLSNLKQLMGVAYAATQSWLDQARVEVEAERKAEEDAAYFTKVDEFHKDWYGCGPITPTAKLAPEEQKKRVDRYERMVEKYVRPSQN